MEANNVNDFFKALQNDVNPMLNNINGIMSTVGKFIEQSKSQMTPEQQKEVDSILSKTNGELKNISDQLSKLGNG